MYKIGLVVSLIICPLLAAQQTLDKEPFNNTSVIKLTKAGFAEDLIVTSINRSHGTYDVSTDGLVSLRSAGVGNKVVAAMVRKSAGESVSSLLPGTPDGKLAATAQPSPPQPLSTLHSSAASAAKPRVLVNSRSHSNLWNGSRNQSMEMSKDFSQFCPAVQITLNENLADFTVNLNHIEHGFARDNQLQVVNKTGDLVSEVADGGSIKGDVKKACATIVANWSKN